jgi:hypothetical protein
MITGSDPDDRGGAFGIGEHGGGVTVKIATTEDEDGQSLPFQFAPVVRNDVATDGFW